MSSAQQLTYESRPQAGSHNEPQAALGLIALIVSATAIGFAIHLRGGEYTPVAISLITVAIVGTVIGLVASCRVMTGKRFLSWIEATFAAALAIQFLALYLLWPVGVDQKEPFLSRSNRFVYLYLIASSCFLLVLGYFNARSIRRWWFPALLVVHSLLGFWAVRSSPVPHIDVWYFQEVGPQTLLSGRNPYDYSQVRFNDIYNSTLPGHQRVYGEGMVEDGHLKFGFPYPPVSLFCSTLGVLLGNDPRYAQAVALTLAGLCIGYSRPGRIPKFAAVLLLFTPSVWFVLQRAWTEPFVIFFLAAAIFCSARQLRWLLPVAFGLFLGSKQYLVFAVPLSFLLVDDFNWRTKSSWRSWFLLLLGAAIVFALTTLPLAIWNFQAFWFSLVTVQKDAPFRWDALSYLVWMGFNIDSKYTTWVWLAFVGAMLTMLLSLWKARRGPAGFAVAMSLTYLVFIAFNKQAFCNYYFFVIGCLCCAIAATGNDRVGNPTAALMMSLLTTSN